jgi:hypothetical protein
MKKKISKFLLFASLFFLLSAVIPEAANAQCPMCRMSAEADLKNGGLKAKGLNAGILYMLSFPYILLGTFGFIWYRERRKIEEVEQLRELRNLLDPHDWKAE